jgi:hypothetical protein
LSPFFILIPIHTLSSPIKASLLEAHFIPVNYGDCILLKIALEEIMLITRDTNEGGDGVHYFFVGLGDELIQGILPNRVYQFSDVLLNFSGGILGGLILITFNPVLMKAKKSV